MFDPPRVLLVDDERLMRLAVSHRLAAEGFRVHDVGSAAAACEILARESFDLIVTDLRFEGATGLEVVRAAQRLQPKAAVILLTGSAEADELHEAVRAGASAVLVKPCALADLSREFGRSCTAGGVSKSATDASGPIRS